MDHERVGFTSAATYQDGSAISAFAFNRRIGRFQHWRRRGHPSNERRRNDLERPLWKSCLLYTSPSPRDGLLSRMPSSA